MYSSGESKVDLQGGLITDITLDPNQTTTFRYFKQSQQPIYLTIATAQAGHLEHLAITAYHFDIPKDEVRTQFYLEKPALER